jgi:hypothetical protein
LEVLICTCRKREERLYDLSRRIVGKEENIKGECSLCLDFHRPSSFVRVSRDDFDPRMLPSRNEDGSSASCGCLCVDC